MVQFHHRLWCVCIIRDNSPYPTLKVQRVELKMREKRFLSTKEVARLFEVSPNTVTRWAREAKVPALVTPSGRHKFPRDEIRRLVRDSEPTSGKQQEERRKES